jgi:FkbM family methyltransferase
MQRLSLKKLLKKFFNKLGFNITKINKEINNINFDDLLKKKIIDNPIIFDVGGNRGQSIERFKKLFKNPTIHSFEPIKSEFDFMKKKFKSEKNIYLNNFALGDKIEEKEFNITAKKSNSSFNKINLEGKWIKMRSSQYKTKIESFVASRQKVKIYTLDQYCLDKKINKIHLLKIDTQGYEDKVLHGSMNQLKINIKAIVTEIIFDNVYNKYFSFSDIEKYILPNNFRMIGIDLANNNLFSGLSFFANVYYFNKKYYNLS